VVVPGGVAFLEHPADAAAIAVRNARLRAVNHCARIPEF
jgi:hypothetical protein